MRVTSYDDIAAAALERIAAACVAGDGREPLDEAARLHLAHHGLHDAALWLSDDGFALLRRHGASHDAGQQAGNGAGTGTGTGPDAAHHAGGVRHELDLAVAPAARRTGQGQALLTAALAETGADPVTAWSHGDHPAARALASAHAFHPTRELLVLTLDTRGQNAPVAAAKSTVSSASITVRPWRETDAAALLRVNAAAFAAHPEQGAMDAANLAQRMAEPWFDPAGLLVAADTDGVLLGFHWTKVHPGGHGEVYVVAVDPSQHGRGLGRTLLEAGLAHLTAVGCHRVHLYVEADNAPALALYRRLGFTTDHAHVQYARP